MKTIKTTTVLLMILVCFARSTMGQGFVNLDFEDATVVPTEPVYGWLDWNLAVPGWDHSAGGDTQHVFWGSAHLGLSQYYLLMDSTSPVYAPNHQLAGDYSLAFVSGIQNAGDPSSPWVNAYISQIGSIPLGTQSLRILATGPFQVFVGGVNIPMYSLGGNSYGGNISSFAGMVAEMKIINTATTIPMPTVVDDISFSTTSVPEPASITLFVTSMAFLIYRRTTHAI
jgi:hypothetical protein